MIYIWSVSEHISYMKRCLELAIKGLGAVEPNPMVGCVIVKDGNIVAEGYHKEFGKEHAEVMAINALDNSIATEDCTIYVSLEPCSHFGKTPPCADLIIKHGFKEVVIGALDPNPEVSSKGLAKIKEAGLEVIHGVMAQECRAINKAFYYFHENQRPYITLKWAQTADGFIGRHIAEAHLGKQISNQESKPFIHRLRATHAAIAIGANTANLDNPLLTTRDWQGRNPVKVIISQRNTVEPGLQLFKEGRTLVYNTLKEDKDLNVEYVKIKFRNFLEHLFEDLYNKGIQSVLVEGGSMVHQSLIDNGIWNEAYVIQGDQIWEKGVTAAKMDRDHSDQFDIGDQKVFHYINR